MDKKYEIEYKGKKIEYIIKKAKVKNMYIKIKNGIVEVKIPNRVTIEYAINLVETKKKWIFDSLNKQNIHEDRNIDLKNKDYIYILDNKIPIEYYYTNLNRINIKLSEEYCKIYIPNTIKSEKELIQKIEKKLYEKEKEFAEQKVTMAMEKYIKLTGVKPKSYSIRKFKSIWGNCSSKKEIKINQNVIWYSQKEIEYVCLHEICHLKYMNHQKEFWNMVEKYMPDYKESIKRFKE